MSELFNIMSELFNSTTIEFTTSLPRRLPCRSCCLAFVPPDTNSPTCTDLNVAMVTHSNAWSYTFHCVVRLGRPLRPQGQSCSCFSNLVPVSDEILVEEAGAASEAGVHSEAETLDVGVAETSAWQAEVQLKRGSISSSGGLGPHFSVLVEIKVCSDVVGVFFSGGFRGRGSYRDTRGGRGGFSRDDDRGFSPRGGRGGFRGSRGGSPRGGFRDGPSRFRDEPRGPPRDRSRETRDSFGYAGMRIADTLATRSLTCFIFSCSKTSPTLFRSRRRRVQQWQWGFQGLWLQFTRRTQRLWGQN